MCIDCQDRERPRRVVMTFEMDVEEEISVDMLRDAAIRLLLRDVETWPGVAQVWMEVEEED